MPQYLKFNIKADQVCITPQSTYFKLRDIDSDCQSEEVCVSEEYFPLLTKILEKGDELSELLAFESYGEHFIRAITDTQEHYNLINDLDMVMLFEKNLSHIAWPCKNDDLLNEWHESSELQSDFPDVNEFISEKRQEEIWSVSEIWEISYGEKVDLTQDSLGNFSAGGWALDGGYIEEPNRFVGFANIANIEVEFFDGDESKSLAEAELKQMLLAQYSDDADELENLKPTTQVDRGILNEKFKQQRSSKRKSRLIKITVFLCITLGYFGWVNGYF